MGVESDLRALLLANDDIVSIVDQKVYEGEVPQSRAFPYVVYKEISGDFQATHDGPSRSDRYIYQVISFSTSRDEARTLALKLRTALDAQPLVANTGGSLGILDIEDLGPPYLEGSNSINNRRGICLLDDEYLNTERPASAQDSVIYSIVQQYIIWAQ